MDFLCVQDYIVVYSKLCLRTSINVTLSMCLYVHKLKNYSGVFSSVI